MTRAQMAIFILRGKHGSDYQPPPATGTVFNDVPKTAFCADWIERFAAEGITPGAASRCTARTTRSPAARWRSSSCGPNTAAATARRRRSDSSATLRRRAVCEMDRAAGRDGITAGCGGGNYCPTLPSTRGQMAVFLTKTFAESSQALIADDLADDDIDYETSLLYRFYALFSDGRLPARYQTAPSDGEDAGLYEEAELVFPDLSAAGQSALAPFLARPDDPASPFGPAASSSPSEGGRRRGGDALRERVDWNEPAREPLQDHLCASGDDTADGNLSGLNTIADDFWDPMTKALRRWGTPSRTATRRPGGSEICPGGNGRRRLCARREPVLGSPPALLAPDIDRRRPSVPASPW